MTALEKPVPVPGDQNRPYWNAAKEHRFVLCRCHDCGRYSLQPRIVCPQCRGEVFEWAEVSGRGVIHSYTVARQTSTLGFHDEVPYVVVLVAIAEQPDLIVTTNLVGEYDVDSLRVDLPVVVEFEDRGDVTVPQFRLEGAK